MQALLDHAEERGVRDRDSQLLRLSDGRSLAASRYERLWNRLRKYVKAVEAQSISTHWLRHTTLTWVERNFGPAVAAAYAGHSQGNLWRGATSLYVKAGLEEVATALQALTGERHPLALVGSWTVEADDVHPLQEADRPLELATDARPDGEPTIPEVCEVLDHSPQQMLDAARGGGIEVCGGAAFEQASQGLVDE